MIDPKQPLPSGPPSSGPPGSVPGSPLPFSEGASGWASASRDAVSFLSRSGVLEALSRRYQPLDVLGSGSFGVVVRALDRDLDREVALKLLYRANERRRARFLREGEIVARLNHRHVLPVHDLGDANGVLYLAQSYVAGATTLAAMSPLPIHRAAALLRDVARAVHHAHEQGVIHRDIKPDNVLVAEGDRAFLIDFGLAWHEEAEQLTSTGMGLGTLAFSAPEQLLGERADARSDVYGLGATLYYALTAELPVDMEGGLAAVYREQARPPSSRRPGLPNDLDALVLRCLAKQPDERWNDAAELALALDDFLDGQKVRGPRRAVRLAPAWLLLAALLVASLGVAAWMASRPRPTTVEPKGPTGPPPRPPAPPPPRSGPDPPPGSSRALEEAREALVRARKLEAEQADLDAPLAELTRGRALARGDAALEGELAAAAIGYLLRKGQAERALELARAETSLEARLLEARALVRLERGAEAQALLEALEADEGYHGRMAGSLLRHLRRTEAAVGRELARRAYELRPGDARALLLQGLHQDRLEDDAEARTSLERASEKDPLDPDPPAALAALHQEAGRKEEALRQADLAVKRGEPAPPRAALLLRGGLSVELKKDAPEQALQDLDRGLSASPPRGKRSAEEVRAANQEQARALFWRGVQKLRIRKARGGAGGAHAAIERVRAEDDLRKALDLGPELVQGLTRGLTSEEAEQVGAAQAR